MHLSVNIYSTEKNMPEAIEFYNKTKCIAAFADQMARPYFVKEGTRRWPITLLYYMQGLTFINVFAICKTNSEDTLLR